MFLGILMTIAGAVTAGSIIGELFSSPDDDTPKKIGGMVGLAIGVGEVLSSLDAPNGNNTIDNGL